MYNLNWHVNLLYIYHAMCWIRQKPRSQYLTPVLATKPLKYVSLNAVIFPIEFCSSEQEMFNASPEICDAAFFLALTTLPTRNCTVIFEVFRQS